MKEDEVYRVMSKNQELSVIAVTATKLVAEAQQRHKSAPTATAAIGRNLIASLLLGTFKGDDESVQLRRVFFFFFFVFFVRLFFFFFFFVSSGGFTFEENEDRDEEKCRCVRFPGVVDR